MDSLFIKQIMSKYWRADLVPNLPKIYRDKKCNTIYFVTSDTAATKSFDALRNISSSPYSKYEWITQLCY